MDFLTNYWPYIALAFFFLLFLILAMTTVQQGQVAIVTRFGQYKKVFKPGLNFKTPFLDSVFKRISTQNRSTELKFQAITLDQANVYFKAMLLYSVKDSEDETIKNVAFKFNSDEEFMQSLTRTIEGSIRSHVATKKQSEILTLRSEITTFVKSNIDLSLSTWGYHLQDLQINDITFDAAIMESMSKVVASSNLKAAAENEGQALLITKTKAAEAEGNFIKISAQAEKEAAELRGQGVAAFREAVSKGLSQSAEQLKQSGLDTNVILFSMWTEAIKNFAEVGKGNVIFLDGSPEGMQKQMNQMLGMLQAKTIKNGSPVTVGN